MQILKTLGLLIPLAPLAFVLAAEPSSGVKLFHENKFAEAEAALREELNAQPGNAEAAATHALALLRLDRKADARATAERAVEMAPGQAVVHLAAAEVAAEDNRLDDANRALESAAQADASHPRTAYVRGLVKVVRKDFAGAAQDLEKACADEPRNAYAHYYAGLAYNQVKRPDRMVSHFESFLKLAPNAPEAARVRSVMRTVR
jgi:tetratricopeptide (TPR) repeat protein